MADWKGPTKQEPHNLRQAVRFKKPKRLRIAGLRCFSPLNRGEGDQASTDQRHRHRLRHDDVELTGKRA